MPRGPNNRKKELADHTKEAYPWLRAVLSYGYGVVVPIGGIEAANVTKFRQGLFNAGRHEKVSVTCKAKKQPDGTYTLYTAVYTKTDGRAYVLRTHGSDRTKWPYNPRRPSPRDDAGKRTDI